MKEDRFGRKQADGHSRAAYFARHAMGRAELNKERAEKRDGKRKARVLNRRALRQAKWLMIAA